MEDESRAAAPGSTPFLSAAAMAANIQSQAMMQKMLAAMLRQEAGRIAHENGLRKRQGIAIARIRQGISDVLRRWKSKSSAALVLERPRTTPAGVVKPRYPQPAA